MGLCFIYSLIWHVFVFGFFALVFNGKIGLNWFLEGGKWCPTTYAERKSTPIGAEKTEINN